MRPGGRREFELVGRVTAEGWTRFARRARPPRVKLREYRVFEGAGPHDVAPARDGTVWFTAQRFRVRSPGANVRQLVGRPGEVWGAESGADRLVVARWRR